MPSSNNLYPDGSPPIPSYDEAVASNGSSSSWAPPRSPIDDRPDHLTEAETLLGSSRNRPTDTSRRRMPAGYRPPHVESDDEDSDDEIDGLDEDDEDTQMRREMQELEIEDPLNGSTGTRSSQWRKRIGFSLSFPQWRWPLRLPRLTVRLPRASDSAGPHPGTPVSTEPSSTGFRRFRERFQFPNIQSTTALLLVGRLLAILLVMGFLYLLFMSDLFANMSRRLGGQIFDPDSIRAHVQMMVDPEQMKATLQHFTSYPHIAGTEGDYALAMDVRNAFLKYELETTTVDEYYVYLTYPKADGRAVQLLSQGKRDESVTWTAKLDEDAISNEASGRQTYAFHAHSKSGDVKGPLMYANYGSMQDFKVFYDSGIDTKGAIALVRYHGSEEDPALKVRAAQLAGFAGCILYSDPADDGFLKGPEAPNGNFMPADGVQRASVSLKNWVIGDVLTPGWESIKGMPRMKVEQTKGLVGIPSIPLAWRDAADLLRAIKGVGVQPQEGGWQGGIPGVDYWTGNLSSPVVRLMNLQDENEQQPIWNVYSKIAGIEQSEKAIMLGNHRDALALGAVDPGSGTAVFLEVARILGDLVGKGWRPLRTIEFMSWDATKYNFIGSTEFVEKNLDALRMDAFAYINLGAAVFGSKFRATGSPMMRKILLHVLERVQDPKLNASLKQLWDDQSNELLAPGMDGDYVAFQDIAGTSSIDLSFVADGLPLNSAYDTFDWMDQVGDPGFTYHNLLAQIVVLLVVELADRPVLPFDMTNYALRLEDYVNDLITWSENKGANLAGDEPFDLGILKAAIGEVHEAVTKFEEWETGWEQSVVGSGGWEPAGLGRQRLEYNNRMAAFETALLDINVGGGIPNRTQFKHVVFGPQLWSEDSNAHFPAIRDAVLAKDWNLANSTVSKTAGILSQAAQMLLV